MGPDNHKESGFAGVSSKSPEELGSTGRESLPADDGFAEAGGRQASSGSGVPSFMPEAATILRALRRSHPLWAFQGPHSLAYVPARQGEGNRPLRRPRRCRSS